MRTPAFSPLNAGRFCPRPTTPKLVGRFPDETRQPAQSGSLSKLIVKPGSVRAMVTNDYRALPKGVYVRFRKKPPLPPTTGATNPSPKTNRGCPSLSRFLAPGWDSTATSSIGFVQHEDFGRQHHFAASDLFRPTLPHSRQKFLLVRPNQSDQRLITRLLVRARPQHHLRQHRSQINSFRRQPVNQLPSIPGVRPRRDNPVSAQLAQPVRQYIGRDPFITLHELLICPEIPQHHVADNQQRPAVSQHLNRCIQRTLRSPFNLAFLSHLATLDNTILDSSSH